MVVLRPLELVVLRDGGEAVVLPAQLPLTHSCPFEHPSTVPSKHPTTHLLSTHIWSVPHSPHWVQTQVWSAEHSLSRLHLSGGAGEVLVEKEEGVVFGVERVVESGAGVASGVDFLEVAVLARIPMLVEDFPGLLVAAVVVLLGPPPGVAGDPVTDADVFGVRFPGGLAEDFVVAFLPMEEVVGGFVLDFVVLGDVCGGV